MPDELDACPICGTSVVIRERDNYFGHCYWIECPNCHCKTDEHSDKEELIYGWRARPVSRVPLVHLCPLCGGWNVSIQYHQKDNRYRVKCDAYRDNMCCGFSTPWMATQQEAVDTWNGLDIEEDEKQ